jgi:hypothetical protein
MTNVCSNICTHTYCTLYKTRTKLKTRRMSLATLKYGCKLISIYLYFVILSFEKLAIVDQSVSGRFGQTVRASVRMTIFDFFP